MSLYASTQNGNYPSAFWGSSANWVEKIKKGKMTELDISLYKWKQKKKKFWR